MLDWLVEPFTQEFMQRALLAGVLAAATTAVVGTWVVLRGLTFMGEALAHGILPGVAVAFLAGFDLTIGAAASAVLMVAGIDVVQRRARLAADAGIGLLFVGMLALGVVIVSRSRSFSADLTGFLFGDVLGVTRGDLLVQGVACVVAVLAVIVLHRALLALAFNADKAAALGLRPRLTNVALLALVTLAVVTSFRPVGALLVFGLLVAPPATASLLARRVPVMMLVAVGFGTASVVAGLLVSYHADAPAGAAIVGIAVLTFFVVLAARETTVWLRRRRAPEGGPAGAGYARP